MIMKSLLNALQKVGFLDMLLAKRWTFHYGGLHSENTSVLEIYLHAQTPMSFDRRLLTEKSGVSMNLW